MSRGGILSGVAIKSWEGAGLPEDEDHVYSYVHSKSSFTVLAFTILTFAITWGVASALSSTVGSASASFAGASTISPLTSATIGAGLYAGVAMVQGAGLTSAQASWAGSTGNGVLTPNTGAWNEHQQRLVQGAKNLQINSSIGTGLSGVTKLYAGNCDQTWAIQQCLDHGLDPGTMHRVDNYAESNITLILQAAKEKCWAELPQQTKALVIAGTDLVFKEQIRKQVQQCAAPHRRDWEEN